MPEPNGVVATHYRIDPSRPAPALQGGLAGFTVIDRREPNQHLMAVATRPDLPPRPKITLARNSPPVPHTILPVDYGPGRDPAGHPRWFVICEGLGGAPVGLGKPWREQDLILQVLQPAADSLEALALRGLTHRAINPANLFRAGARDPVTLGPFWAAPPASLQPAVFEPPYVAACLSNARGDGVIADDIYALGVTILALVLGRVPLAGQTDAAILRRKTERGSYAALTADATLTPLIADLLKGMLADDPDHRPSPALLLRPEQARARRVAARPPRRALQALTVGGEAVWSARELAQAMGQHPEPAYALLKTGAVEKWLRRHLGDPQMGMDLEEAIRRAREEADRDEARQQSALVMRCVAAIDPRAPLVWRGYAVQPDGIGPALVGAPPDLAAALEEIVGAQAVGTFLSVAVKRTELTGLVEDQRSWRSWLASAGPAGGARRLMYGMNPMLACGSPLLNGHPVVRVSDLLPALEAAAAAADRSRPPIDPHIAAFLAARLDAQLGSELAALKSFAGIEDRLAVLRLFGQLQTRLHPDPLPGLSGWLVTSGFASVTSIRNHKSRADLQARIEAAASAGQIASIAAAADNTAIRQADQRNAEAVARRVAQLQVALDAIEQGAEGRQQSALALGTEIVAGVGLLANIGVVIGLAVQ